MIKITRSIQLFAVCVFLFGVGTASAQGLSCDELADVADTAADVRDALEEIGTITEGDEVDSALGDLINELKLIAAEEGNEVLEDHIDIMDDGWERMDGESLMTGLDGAIDSMDTLFSNDC